MRNYKVTYTKEYIELKFKSVIVRVHNVTPEVTKTINELIENTNNFKYVFRALQINPNLTIQTIKN